MSGELADYDPTGPTLSRLDDLRISLDQYNGALIGRLKAVEIVFTQPANLGPDGEPAFANKQVHFKDSDYTLEQARLEYGELSPDEISLGYMATIGFMDKRAIAEQIVWHIRQRWILSN